MEFSDKNLTCRECGNDFLFTAGEQAFFQQKGLVNQPGRCPDCRIKRRTAAASSGVTEAPVAAPSPEVSTVKEVSTVICAECGVETTVPFRPRLARPVYCSSCFNKQKQIAAEAQPVGASAASSDQ